MEEFQNLQNCLPIIDHQDLGRRVNDILQSGRYEAFNARDLIIPSEKSSKEYLAHFKKLGLRSVVLNNPAINDVDIFLDFLASIKSITINNPFFLNLPSEPIQWNLKDTKTFIVSGVNYRGSVLDLNFSSDENHQIEQFSFNGNANNLPINILFSGMSVKSMEISNITTGITEEIQNIFQIKKSNITNFSIKNFAATHLELLEQVTVDQLDLKNGGLSDIKINSSNIVHKINLHEVVGSLALEGNKGIQEIKLNTKRLYFKIKDCEITKISSMNGSRVFDISNTKIKYLKSTSVNFVKLEFSGGEIEKSKFDKTTFSDKLLFANVLFEEAPEFVTSDICVNSHFVDCVFKDFEEKAIPRYRWLKTEFSKLGNDLDEKLFSSLEIQSKVQVTKFRNEPLTKIAGAFYSFFNSYGRSVTKPLYVYILSVFLFSFAYSLLFEVDIYYSGGNSIAGIQIYWGEWILAKDWKRDLVFSFFNSLGPFRYLLKIDFLYIQNFTGKVLVFIQGLLSSINIYLLVVGIKNRFKQV